MNNISEIKINTEVELKKINLDGKWNNYISVQKEVINVLREEGFFANKNVTNEKSGMNIRITTKGIRETLGNGKRFQNLPKKLKVYKIATIRYLPELLRTGYVIDDNVENKHNADGYMYAYI